MALNRQKKGSCTTIDGIYVAVRERGLVISKRRCSQEFLERASNYASDMGLGRCSTGALVHLYCSLGEIGQAALQAAVLARLLGAEVQP
jgi:hypothetical protein